MRRKNFLKTLGMALALSLLVCVIQTGFVGVFATDEPYSDGDFKFTVSNGNAEIVDYTGTDGDVVIPATLSSSEISPDDLEGNDKNCSVTSIGYGAFRGKQITSVEFSGATSIGVTAFEDCTSLASVKFSGATSVGANAFKDCTSLTSVDFSSVFDFDDGSFANTGLVTVSIDGLENSKLSMVNSREVFSGCRNLKSVSLKNLDELSSLSLIMDYCPSMEEVNIVNCSFTISSICGFYSTGNTSPQKVYIENVSSLGRTDFIEFESCKNLEEVTLKDVAFISSAAFQYCDKLEKVTLINVGTIQDRAFGMCSALKDIYVEDTNPSHWTNVSVENDQDPFFQCYQFGLTFHCPRGSAMYHYAENHNYFVDSGNFADIFVNMGTFFPRLFKSLWKSGI